MTRTQSSWSSRQRNPKKTKPNKCPFIYSARQKNTKQKSFPGPGTEKKSDVFSQGRSKIRILLLLCPQHGECGRCKSVWKRNKTEDNREVFISKFSTRFRFKARLKKKNKRQNKQMSKLVYFHKQYLLITAFGKISAQPYPTSCIQFLDREKNDKKQYIAIGKTDLFYNSMGLCGNFTRPFRCLIVSFQKTLLGRVYFKSEFILSRVLYVDFFGNEHRGCEQKTKIGQLCPTLS